MQESIEFSKYCDYNECFKDYDLVRRPFGVNEILEILRLVHVSLNDLVLLEGGFGTGAYTSILANYVGKIYGIEASTTGYRKAVEKLKNRSNVVLSIGNILELKFPENFFDAYLVNQVIHHLDDSEDYPNLTIFLKEAYRVLKPGGVLIVNTCDRQHIDPDDGAFWHYKYMRKAALLLQKKYIPIADLIRRMMESGFEKPELKVPTGKIFDDAYYNDPTVALKPEFHKGDSAYSLLSRSELEETNRLLKRAIEDRSVFREMRRAAKRAEEIGEAVIIFCKKVPR
ncbi:MAG: class I SAM-dependent methyltransferase [Deltaproteobacteria bacterium]|nr:class I SAM-dependent methyltransferase [Deltaproteobacteria bacterium]MBW2067948.1 class I SAM-dependent methyltransferase [Deltaproteobacteria bacterium]